MAKTKGLYRRGKVWWLNFVAPDGKRYFESTKTSLKTEAEYILTCRRKEIAEGITPEVKKIPNYKFSELVDEYMKWAERQKSYSSKCFYLRIILPEFRNIPLRNFNSKMLELFQSKELNKNKKPATVNRYLALIKHMFAKAVEWEMVEEGILKKIRNAKFLPENNKRLRFLSKEECIALFNACVAHLRPIVTIALNTGMRKGELLNLTWAQIDKRHSIILLENTKNGERREIPINETVMSLLLELPEHPESPYIFHNNEGKPYKEIKRSFASACKRADISDFHFHDLRHTFASQLVMAGVDLTTVKELMGHKSFNMTLRYAHLASAHKLNAVRILDVALKQEKPQQTETFYPASFNS